MKKRFEHLITGKRVIFVASSRLLEGTMKGSWIDSYDTVIRTNGGFPVQEKYIDDYGKRCDVLYINVSFSKMVYPLPVEKYNKHGLSWVCYKNNPPIGNVELMAKYNQYIQVRSFHKSIQKLHPKISGLLSGSAIIDDVLSLSPKELMLTGFTFYIEGLWNWDKCYFDNYLPKNTFEKAMREKKAGKLKPHNIEDNNKYMINLYKKGAIKIDDDSLKILGLYN